jgi:hypothetical protein
MIPGFPTRLKEEVESRFGERVLKGASTNTSSIKMRVIDLQQENSKFSLELPLLLNKQPLSRKHGQIKENMNKRAKIK